MTSLLWEKEEVRVVCVSLTYFQTDWEGVVEKGVLSPHWLPLLLDVEPE